MSVGVCMRSFRFALSSSSVSSSSLVPPSPHNRIHTFIHSFQPILYGNAPNIQLAFRPPSLSHFVHLCNFSQNEFHCVFAAYSRHLTTQHTIVDLKKGGQRTVDRVLRLIDTFNRPDAILLLLTRHTNYNFHRRKIII